MFGERECGRPVEWQPGVEMVVLGAAVKSRGGVEVCGAALGGGPCLDSAAGRDALVDAGSPSLAVCRESPLHAISSSSSHSSWGNKVGKVLSSILDHRDGV